MSRARTAAGVSVGVRSRSRATEPVTNGAAMDVPSDTTCWLSGMIRAVAHAAVCDSADATPFPGAARSGFSTPSRRGPGLENTARSPSRSGLAYARACPVTSCHCSRVTYAPTASTCVAVAGESTR